MSTYNDFHSFWDTKFFYSSTHLTPYAEGEYDWINPDNYENFKKNPKPNYTTKSFTYKINRLGFRCMDIDEALTNGKPTICAFGCSYTMGIGIAEADNWPNQLRNLINPNYNLLNFSIGGSSSDTIVRYLHMVLENFNPFLVAILWPYSARYEEYNYIPKDPNLCPTNLGPWLAKTGIDHYDDTHFYNLKVKNMIMANLLLKKHNTKAIQYNINEPEYKEFLDSPKLDVWEDSSGGRDGHPGPIWHGLVAKKYYTKFTEMQ